MTNITVTIPIRDFLGNSVRYQQVSAETVAGLWVHKDHAGRGWVVTAKSGLAVFGAPVSSTATAEIPTRAEARRVARYLGPQMPYEVKEGEWNGKQWAERDPQAVDSFKNSLHMLSLLAERKVSYAL